MACPQTIVIYIIVLGIVGVYSVPPEDIENQRDLLENSALDQLRNSQETFERRVAKHNLNPDTQFHGFSTSNESTIQIEEVQRIIGEGFEGIEGVELIRQQHEDSWTLAEEMLESLQREDAIQEDIENQRDLLENSALDQLRNSQETFEQRVAIHNLNPDTQFHGFSTSNESTIRIEEVQRIIAEGFEGIEGVELIRQQHEDSWTLAEEMLESLQREDAIQEDIENQRDLLENSALDQLRNSQETFERRVAIHNLNPDTQFHGFYTSNESTIHIEEVQRIIAERFEGIEGLELNRQQHEDSWTLAEEMLESLPREDAIQEDIENQRDLLENSALDQLRNSQETFERRVAIHNLNPDTQFHGFSISNESTIHIEEVQRIIAEGFEGIEGVGLNRQQHEDSWTLAEEMLESLQREDATQEQERSKAAVLDNSKVAEVHQNQSRENRTLCSEKAGQSVQPDVADARWKKRREWEHNRMVKGLRNPEVAEARRKQKREYYYKRKAKEMQISGAVDARREKRKEWDERKKEREERNPELKEVNRKRCREYYWRKKALKLAGSEDPDVLETFQNKSREAHYQRKAKRLQNAESNS